MQVMADDTVEHPGIQHQPGGTEAERAGQKADHDRQRHDAEVVSDETSKRAAGKRVEHRGDAEHEHRKPHHRPGMGPVGRSGTSDHRPEEGAEDARLTRVASRGARPGAIRPLGRCSTAGWSWWGAERAPSVSWSPVRPTEPVRPAVHAVSLPHASRRGQRERAVHVGDRVCSSRPGTSVRGSVPRRSRFQHKRVDAGQPSGARQNPDDDAHPGNPLRCTLPLPVRAARRTYPPV